MKFLTFLFDGAEQLGLLKEDYAVLNLTRAWHCHFGESKRSAPTNLWELLELGEEGMANVRRLDEGATPEYIHRLSDVRILAPIPVPKRNIFCVGRNYREHIIEGNLARGRDPNDFPKAVEFFSKAPSTVVGHLSTVKRHEGVTNFLDYEVELGIVMGKRGTNISHADAMEHIFGYTIVNDITARDLQTLHGQWFKGKSLDTTCPIGPVVVHKSAIADPHRLVIELDVNGELRQHANTSSLLFRIEDIIVQLSAGLTLEAGDIIATGTPSGVGLGLSPPQSLITGDVVRARISGIGELENTIGN